MHYSAATVRTLEPSLRLLGRIRFSPDKFVAAIHSRCSLALLCTSFVLVLSGPVALGADEIRVDRLLVVKSERKLYALRKEKIVRSMDISLGLVPEGHKEREGDFRTPEGVYYIEARNSASDYFLSLKISYPNAVDRNRARQHGVDPGGQIMIHGMPNEPRYQESRYSGWDWTDGCIAVSNSDMIDLWLMTAVQTPIEIRP